MRSPLVRMWYMSLDTSAHCLVSASSVAAWSMPTMAVRSSAVFSTAFVTTDCRCSWLPKGAPRAVVDPSESNISTDSLTYAVSHPANSCRLSTGQRSLAELFAFPSTILPRVPLKVLIPLSTARSHDSTSAGLTKAWPSSMNHSSQAPSAGPPLRLEDQCCARARPSVRPACEVPNASPCSAPRSVACSTPEGSMVVEHCS